jgi:hypothetical protein
MEMELICTEFMRLSPSTVIFGLSHSAATVGQAVPASTQTDEGWILLAPRFGKETLLLDTKGRLRHTWKSEASNGGGARLLPDGAVMRVIDMAKEKTFQGVGLVGGGVEILEWDGSLRWRFWNAVTHTMGVADAVQLPNGNILMAALEWLSPEEALEAGRPPESVDPFGLLVPALMEYRPKGESAGIPVWKWSLKHHLFQKREPSLARHHPEGLPGCVDIGEPLESKGRRWLMPRQLSYHPGEDLIVLTVSGLGEAWVIDHSTSEAEAASDGGGKRGRGGRILKRIRRSEDDDGNTEGGILMAEWNHSGDQLQSRMDVVTFHEGAYSRVKLCLDANGSETSQRVEFSWVAKIDRQSSEERSFVPSIIAPLEENWLLVSKNLGEVRLVDGLQHGIWSFRSQSGIRRFKVASPKAAGRSERVVDASKEEKASIQGQIQSMAPVESVRIYGSNDIAIPIK